MAVVDLVADWYLRRTLRRAFRCVVWIGERPRIPNGPLVVYANHHSFFDGHLLLYVIRSLLSRPSRLWMEEFDRFPFLRAYGIRPFPADDARRRARTVRETARQFRDGAPLGLAYFPEARLHDPREGILPVPAVRLARLDEILGHPTWWPIGIRIESWRHALPTALLTAGRPHRGIDDRTWPQVGALVDRLAESGAAGGTTILRGTSTPDEQWARTPVIS